jgi:hypothetical protein
MQQESSFNLLAVGGQEMYHPSSSYNVFIHPYAAL